jgi:hypothetical protein
MDMQRLSGACSQVTREFCSIQTAETDFGTKNWVSDEDSNVGRVLKVRFTSYPGSRDLSNPLGRDLQQITGAGEMIHFITLVLPLGFAKLGNISI